MRILDRRRARSTSRRMLPDEERRVSSFWIPAFMAAVAASECGEEAAMLREADGGEASGEGGSELISGGMVAVVGWWGDGVMKDLPWQADS
jgi:hypothetical protein